MQWSYFYTLDAQSRLMLPYEALSSLSASSGHYYPRIRGDLCLADTALGIRKPCILFFLKDHLPSDERELPQGIRPVAVAGYNPNRGNSVGDDGRIRLKKHQTIHLSGRSRMEGMSKKDRTMMVLGLGDYMVITNSNLWL